MLLDLWPTQGPAAPSGQGGGASGNDFSPSDLRRLYRQAASGAVAAPHQYPQPRSAAAPSRFDTDVAVVLYELGEIDEAELTALLTR